MKSECVTCGSKEAISLNLAKDLGALRHPLAGYVPKSTWLCYAHAAEYMNAFNRLLSPRSQQATWTAAKVLEIFGESSH